jgi:acyl carrier protein
MGHDVTPLEMKKFIIETLGLEDIQPEDIGDDDPLFVEGLGLDSIDGLELDMALRKTFHLEAPSEPGARHFMSVNALVAYVAGMANA